MAQEMLPQDMNLGRDTHDLIVSFAVEFIHLLTFQANEICQKETNNGYISLQHVIRACEELGFEEFVGEIENVSAVYESDLRTMQKVVCPTPCFTRNAYQRNERKRLDGGVMDLTWRIWRRFKRSCLRNQGSDLKKDRWIAASNNEFDSRLLLLNTISHML